MKKYIIILLALMVLVPDANAQRRKKNRQKPQKEEVVEDPRITQMLSATQQIMFIDSMVVDFNDFTSYIPVSIDCGQLSMNDSAGLFVNELRDHKLEAVYSTSDSLFTMNESHYMAMEWTEPKPVKGLGEGSANFPYMMPDGSTLYYAQKGEKSIGGYDIFVTRYDADSGTFLKPENIGMPFASEANDYLYAIDETNQLGYFVTDRRQPAGKVCIYIFVPNDIRRVYQTEAYSDEQLRSLACIDSISATWQDKGVRQQALARYKEACRDAKNRAMTAKTGNSSTKSMTPEIDALSHQIEVLEKALLLSRNYYARASENDRNTLRNEILKSERELEILQLELRQKVKDWHNEHYKNTNQ